MVSQDELRKLMSVIDNHVDEFCEGEYMNICSFLKKSFEETEYDATTIDDSDEELDIEMPVMMEIDPPSDIECKDRHGVIIRIGDRIKYCWNNEYLIVKNIYYVGFVNRNYTRIWAETGWMIETNEGAIYSGDVIKLS